MGTAIIGSGISGLAAASKLHEEGHRVTVYEAKDNIGGHVQTVWLPLNEEDARKNNKLLPIEIGVFMFDPHYIHPTIGVMATKLGMKYREIPITFSFYNQKNNLSWNTQSHFNGFTKKIAILLHALKQNLFKHGICQNVSFLMELHRFIEDLPKVCEDKLYRNMSLQDFIIHEKYSENFLENWMLPQMMCWWGVTREYAMLVNIQVIVQSMYYVSIAPQYIFEGGWDHLIEKMSAPFREHILTGRRVNNVIRENGIIKIETLNGTEVYDNVVFAVPPSVTSQILQNKSREEDRILNSFQTITTKVYLHTDTDWLPADQEYSTVNLIQDQRGSFCTLYYGALQKQKPNILVTWGDQLQEIPDPNKTLATTELLRTIPTVEYAKACYNIQSIQGNGGVWHCGAHVDALDPENQKIIPSLWFENSFKSGLSVAEKIKSGKTWKTKSTISS
jgi:predicted NAD/FAD-binding protein